jgi:hypothetical protein
MDPFTFKFCLDSSSELSEKSNFKESNEFKFDIEHIELDNKVILREEEIKTDSFDVEALNSECQSQTDPTSGSNAQKENFKSTNSQFLHQIGNNTQVMELNSSPFEGFNKNNFNNVISIKTDSDFSNFLKSTYNRIRQRQELIDNGLNYIKGPGRKRRNPYKSKQEIVSLSQQFLKAKFVETFNLCSKVKRNDALFTLYFRCLKKLISQITSTCTTLNEYKNPNYKKYVNAYCDAHHAYLEAIDSFKEEGLFERFVEYIVIVYPYEKVRKIIQIMEEDH